MSGILQSVSAVRIFVDDIDRARHSIVTSPERQGWGGTLAFPRDPDGNILTLVG
jgi:hypothetical protein